MLVGEPYSHHVEIPQDANLRGADDGAHFAYARAHDLIVVTKDPDDFEELHRQHPHHPGIFAIYQDNDARDMSDEDIARAIQNVIEAQAPLIDTFHVLNHWRF